MTRTREPQQERSRATRARLLDATVDALAELGWGGTTVAVVAERAGVSRGAAQHHYPTREDLVAAAVAHMAAARMTVAPPASPFPPGARRDPGRRRGGGAVLRRSAVPRRRAVVGGGGVGSVLREQIVPLEATLGAGAHHALVRVLGVDDSRPGVREAVQTTLDLARGLGLADLLTDDTARRARIVRRYAAMLHADLVALDAVPPG